jgi:signal transduction histidine kinase
LKRHISISLRLTFWFSTMFLLGYLIFGSVMSLQLAYHLSAGRNHTLLGRAHRVEGLLATFYLHSSQSRGAEFDALVQAAPESDLVQVFDSRGTRIYPSGSILGDFPWPHWTIGGEREFSKVTYNRRSYRVLSEPATIGATRFRILVGGQLEDNKLILTHFLSGLLWATPAMLILSALGGYFLSRRALDPVSRLIASLHSISIGNLSRRLPIVHTRDELQRLTETCNEMLARLEKAVNQISRFTADASHELRNPISFIYTVSEYALRNPAIDRESAESFAEILRESGEATRLLEDMLALARADAGKAEITFERVNLADILLEAVNKARPQADAKRHEMTLRLDDDPPAWIIGEASSLRRLVSILLDNAIKYTPDQGRIEVCLQVHSTGARISVRDTGIGIPKAALGDIFRRFYRVDEARSLAEGTGLGLAMAKWISETHGGVLSVDSIEHGGSTFQIEFRLAA